MTLLFDLGGVVLSNAWDHQQRALAAAHFSLDTAELEARHAPLAAELECGRLSLDAYLDGVVFDHPRPFSRDEFRQFLFSLSQPNAGTLALLGELKARGAATLATLNNEGREVNEYRIERFGLRRFFAAFFSSCYLGARKPEPEIFRRALGILQAQPSECLFVDDREENLTTPRSLGIASLRFGSAAQLRQELLDRGLLGDAGR